MSQQTDNTPPRFAAGREWRTLGVVAAAALAVRAVLFIGWLSSPLRNFHLVPGLDMQSLLRYGAWDTGAVRPLFSLHRVLIASIRLCCGAEHLVETLAVIQLLCGTATAVLTAYAAFRLWGRRRAALAAGLIAAFYAPAAMYELSMLQETLQLFAFTASLAGILRARKHGFSLSYALTAGALLGLASCGRPTALLWVFAALAWCGYAAWRRGRLRRVGAVAGGVLAVWVLVSVFNWHFSEYYGPFFNVFGYSATVNAAAPAADQAVAAAPAPASAVNSSPVAVLFRIGVNALSRLPNVFLAHEIPDNLNYYFIRDYFPELKLLIGPGLLVPFALAGMVLAVVSGRFLKRDGVILLALFSLALPICANHPMGRYRLILLAPFALLAVEAVRIGFSRPRRRWGVIAVAVLAGAFLINPIPKGRFWRSSDFVAWALALEQPGGRVNAESLATLVEGYRLSGSESTAMNLLIRLIELREYDAAERLIADALPGGRVNPSLLRYYGAMLKLERGDPAGAEVLLRQVEPARLDDLSVKYYFLCAETALRQGKRDEARQLYRRALAEPDFFGFRPMIEAALRKLDGSPAESVEE